MHSRTTNPMPMTTAGSGRIASKDVVGIDDAIAAVSIILSIVPSADIAPDKDTTRFDTVDVGLATDDAATA